MLCFEVWVHTVADFAVSLRDEHRGALQPVLGILRGLRGSLALQRAAFQRLWKFEALSSSLSSLSNVDELLEVSGEVDEACLALCVLSLQHVLQRFLTFGDRPLKFEQWQRWLGLADGQKGSWYVELVLRHIFLCACDPSGDGFRFSNTSPELDRLGAAWGVPPLKCELEGDGLKVSSILRHPDLFKSALDIGQRRPAIAELLHPLKASLESLSEQISHEALTVQEMLGAGDLKCWENPTLVLLLEETGCLEVQVKLQAAVRKLRTMQKLEVAVKEKLPQLFPLEAKASAEACAKLLHDTFLSACGAGPDLQISEVSVPMSEIDEVAWSGAFEDEELKVTIAEVPNPTFLSVLTVLEMLHLAYSAKHKPLRSMFHSAQEEMKRGNWRLSILDSVFFLYKVVASSLELLSELSSGSGLSAKLLSSIQQHWDGVSPQQVASILEDVQAVTFVLGPNLALVGERLQAVLRSRQTVELWQSCSKILTSLSSCLPSKTIPKGFKKDTLQQEASLLAMQRAFETARSQPDVMLTLEDLDRVGHVTEQVQALFEFLGMGAAGFELVLRLVSALAEVPGLSFLRVLLGSAQKGEHVATRMADIMEGGLTQETLATVERASSVFMPLSVAALSAMNSPVDPAKFALMVEDSWSDGVRGFALQATSQADIGELVLKMIKESHDREGPRLTEFFDSLRSALRLGQVVQQKLDENSDDATAVSNTVHGMVRAGYLELILSQDEMHFEVMGGFQFSKGQESITREVRDMQQLTECSDKASLAMPKNNDAETSSALTQDKVQIFTGCIEGVIGLRQVLSDLLQIGHPYLEDMTKLRFPEEGEGLSPSTVKVLKEKLTWAQDAVQQWCSVLDEARAERAVMTCIPARNITKLARAILQDKPAEVGPLMSLELQGLPKFKKQKKCLRKAFRKCKLELSGEEAEDAHKQFLGRLVEVLVSQVVPEQAPVTISILHDIAKKYREARPDDATTQSKKERRALLKFTPKRVMLIKEETTHEPGHSPLQSTATITLLSVLLPLGVAPSSENVLVCDLSTTKDDVQRFLHRLTHATRMDADKQAQVLGVFVHVDCLQLDVLQLLLCKVEAMHAAVGKRKNGGVWAEIELHLIFTLTKKAPASLCESLEKDLCRSQSIKILKLSSIRRILNALDSKCHIVHSDFAGDGKTHAIHSAADWDEDSHVTSWGGAQTRGQAARALRCGTARCVHLELHSFEGGVDADLLLLELLLFRSVFDPERSEWTRLGREIPIFVEVANSIKIPGAPSAQLVLLSAPILQAMPGQWKIEPTSAFEFYDDDLVPTRAAQSAFNFALAGAALLLGEERERLVGWQDDGRCGIRICTVAVPVRSANRASGLCIGGQWPNLC